MILSRRSLFLAPAIVTAANLLRIPGALARTELSSDLTLFVRSDGNDTNDGLSDNSGGALRYPQTAIDRLCNAYDACGKKAKIKLGAGPWTQPLKLYPVLGIKPGGWATSELLLEGNLTTPALLEVTGDHCIVGVACNTQWRVQGLRLSTLTSGKVAVISDLGTNIALGKNEFGPCAGIHTQALNRSSIEWVADYAIDGDAPSGWHWYADQLSQHIFQTLTVTLLNTPSLAGFAAALGGSKIPFGAVTFSGPAAGYRYFVFSKGLIDSAGRGANALPGSMAGIDGGQGGLYIS